MPQLPQAIRSAIAQSIRRHRLQKFPGRGGAKACAEAFGVLPQQWSPWERGIRTPSEPHMQRLAEFFDTTIEEMRRPNIPEDSLQPRPMLEQEQEFFKAIISQKISDTAATPATLPEFLLKSHNTGTKAVFVIQVEMIVTEVRYATSQR
ncbi:MAG: helix-turn-helix transcriptional regulator [Planctomycetaceae bacterium]|nr:helix-turn-helix transcriptional regulator [Planctomycetaceae bacterium]